jgi:hypothetical protein
MGMVARFVYHPTPAWLMKHRRGVIVDVRNESWVVQLDQGLISRLAEREMFTWMQDRAAMRLLCCIVSYTTVRNCGADEQQTRAFL